MKKIVRITRHPLQGHQERELYRIFGPDIQIQTVSETLPTDPREFVSRFDEIAREADVVEAVLPIGLLSAALKFSEFSRRGGMLIRAVMRRELDDDGNVAFHFDHYERVVKVEIVTERL